jgi:glutathione peroxidase
MKFLLKITFTLLTLFSFFMCAGYATNQGGSAPKVSFYNLNIKMNDGSILSTASLKGKKILIVNTASKCGYTKQYDELEKLSEAYKNKLVIIAFPANDFGAQEPGTDEKIAEFCKLNYGVTFPIASKSTVVKGAAQNDVFKWLTDPEKNGWNADEPTWNFSKYLVGEDGVLLAHFASGVAPMDEQITKFLK